MGLVKLPTFLLSGESGRDVTLPYDVTSLPWVLGHCVTPLGLYTSYIRAYIAIDGLQSGKLGPPYGKLGPQYYRCFCNSAK